MGRNTGKGRQRGIKTNLLDNTITVPFQKMPLGRTLLRSVPKAADFDFILQPSKPFTYRLQMDVF